MLDIDISTPSSVMQDLKEKYRLKRVEMKFTQFSLSKMSGVSLGSLKRFESSGEISLNSFLKISLVLECLEDFKGIAEPIKPTISSIDELFGKVK